jgi:hypothetical protein
MRCVPLVCRHQFIFDQWQPKVLYTAEDGGDIHRLDLRIAQNVAPGDLSGKGPGTETIFSNYLFSSGGLRIGGVKALLQCAEGDAWGCCHHLFVGGVGYSVGVLDLRMNVERRATMQRRVKDYGLAGRPSARSGSDLDSGSGSDSESTSEVELTNSDIRNSQFVQTFSPRYCRQAAAPGSGDMISMTSSAYYNRARSKQVSVSGMTCSRRGVLAVSYQGDQVYTFDVNAGTTGASSGGDARRVGPRSVLGGHINHVTFLKNLSFFGPNDEYLVSGSDSGCMWVWDADSGLLADDTGEGLAARVVRPCKVVNLLVAGTGMLTIRRFASRSLSVFGFVVCVCRCQHL